MLEIPGEIHGEKSGLEVAVQLWQIHNSQVMIYLRPLLCGEEIMDYSIHMRL
jgi:hypothetical protein